MVVSQTNRVTSLLLDDLPGRGPMHQRLTIALRAAIRSGRLRPGDRLPPTRVLAVELGLSRWVVTECYDQLKAEGYLQARAGSGTTVAADVLARSPDDRDPRSPTPTPAAPAAPAAAEPARMDLSPRLPDLAAFPRSAWRTALTRALAELEHADLGYPSPHGSARLRRTLVDYLRRVRGIDARPDDVLVTHGTTHGAVLLCRMLVAAGARSIAVEDPGWPWIRQTAAAAGLSVIPVPVDGHGLCVDALDGLDVAAVYLTPAHQFPCGVALRPERRVRLLRWAARRDALVVEDDYDAEFRYDRRPVGALAAMGPDQVAYLGSTSKTLAPALRIGWLIPPRRLLRPLLTALESDCAPTPTIEQHALSILIESGRYDRHLRRMRRSYDQRRAALVDALAAIPGSFASPMAAGVHLLLLLPHDVDESEAVRQATRAGLRVIGLRTFRLTAGLPGLVIGLGGVPARHAATIARTLAAAVTAASPRQMTTHLPVRPPAGSLDNL